MLRFALIALALALSGSAYAQTNVLPEIGIENSGACRNITIRDRSNNALVPIGCIDTSTHTFTPAGGGSGFVSKTGDTLTGQFKFLGGSTTLTDIHSSPPANGVFLSPNGATWDYCSVTGCLPGPHLLGGSVFNMTTRSDANAQESNVSLNTTSQTGKAEDWQASHAYSTGTQIHGPQGDLYQAATSGTSAGSGGPTFCPRSTYGFCAYTGGADASSGADGSVTWSYLGNGINDGKSGFSNAMRVYPGAGHTWGGNTSLHVESGVGRVPMFGWEFDTTNANMDYAVGGPIMANLYLNGSHNYPGTAAIFASMSGPIASYAWHYGMLFQGDQYAKDATIADATSATYVLQGLGAPHSHTAFIRDESTSTTGVSLAGTYAQDAITAGGKIAASNGWCNTSEYHGYVGGTASPNLHCYASKISSALDIAFPSIVGIAQTTNGAPAADSDQTHIQYTQGVIQAQTTREAPQEAGLTINFDIKTGATVHEGDSPDGSYGQKVGLYIPVLARPGAGNGWAINDDMVVLSGVGHRSFYRREGDMTNFNGDYKPGGCVPGSTCSTGGVDGNQINGNMVGEYYTHLGMPITAEFLITGAPQDSGSPTTPRSGSSMHNGMIWQSLPGYTNVGTGLVKDALINDSTNAHDTLQIWGAHDNIINATNSNAIARLISANQGQKICLKNGTDGCFYSGPGSSNFSFDMGGSRAFTVVGGQANGMSLTTGSSGFGPVLNSIGADANIIFNVKSKGSSGIQFLNDTGSNCLLTPGNPTLSCSSDERLKRDIVDTGPALPRLLDMQIRDFTWRSTGQHATGVIAQEMQKTHPDMVRADADGMLAVEAPNPWLLVKAMQDLKADNDNLRLELRIVECAGLLGFLAVGMVFWRRRG